MPNEADFFPFSTLSCETEWNTVVNIHGTCPTVPVGQLYQLTAAANLTYIMCKELEVK